MALKVEGVVDGGMHAEKTLGGASRLKALHFALSSSHRLRQSLRGSAAAPIAAAPGPVDRITRMQHTPSSLGVTAHTSAPRAGHRNSASLAACPARPAVVDRESRIQSGCGSAASEAREWLRGTPRARHDFVYDDADPEHEAVIDTVIVRQCSVLNFPASIRPHCAAGRIRGALSSASPSIGRIERVELVSASNKLVKLTVDFADRRCSVRSLEPQTLCQF